MNNKKTVIRFFTIADYEDEEIWLHNQHMSGWKLVKMILPCFYIFEKCTPAEVAYRLDYKIIRKQVTISKFLGITVGNVFAVVLDGCIFVNR